MPVAKGRPCAVTAVTFGAPGGGRRHGDDKASQLRALLEQDKLSVRTVSSFYDLARRNAPPFVRLRCTGQTETTAGGLSFWLASSFGVIKG